MNLFGACEPIELLGSELEFVNTVPWEVFESVGTRRILSALAIEAPKTVGNVVVITSTWRSAEGDFSYHHRCEGVDWRTGVDMPDVYGSIDAPTRELRIEIAREWASRVRKRCGSEYDVIFGDEKHIDHGHAERDGRKVARVFLEG